MSERVVFMGSPDFALPTLNAVVRHYDLVGVVTQPDRPTGRGQQMQACPVKVRADELALPVFQPISLKLEEAYTKISSWAPDLIVVVAFGEIVPRKILTLPAYGCLNVHASLLPRWRGAAPIQAAIAAGDAKTGVSIMQMEAGLDTGPILAQREVLLEDGITAGELSDHLAVLGAEALLEVLPSWFDGRLKAHPQPNTGWTYASKLSKEDGRLDFSQSAQALARKVNAYNPWPGCFIGLDGKRLRAMKAHAQDSGSAGEPGKRLIVDGLPALSTGDGVLVLDFVQPEGKKLMDGRVYLNGHPKWAASS